MAITSLSALMLPACIHMFRKCQTWFRGRQEPDSEAGFWNGIHKYTNRDQRQKIREIDSQTPATEEERLNIMWSFSFILNKRYMEWNTSLVSFRSPVPSVLSHSCHLFLSASPEQYTGFSSDLGLCRSKYKQKTFFTPILSNYVKNYHFWK